MAWRAKGGIMEIVKKTFTVWYWDSKDQNYRVGKTFKCGKQAEKFADSLKHWEYICIVYSVQIINLDDCA